MQRPDDAKRRSIIDAAIQLFASRAYHEVRLEDVAAEAHVGKGTLYVYFDSKEALYLTLVREGFSEMAAHVDDVTRADGMDTWERLRAAVAALIRFGTRYPDLYRVMRNHTLTPDDPELQATRRRVADRLCELLEEGQRRGEVDDPCPALTTQFILGFVRGALLYPPEGLSPESLERHMMRVLRQGVQNAGTA